MYSLPFVIFGDGHLDGRLMTVGAACRAAGPFGVASDRADRTSHSSLTGMSGPTGSCICVGRPRSPQPRRPVRRPCPGCPYDHGRSGERAADRRSGEGRDRLSQDELMVPALLLRTAGGARPCRAGPARGSGRGPRSAARPPRIRHRSEGSRVLGGALRRRVQKSARVGSSRRATDSCPYAARYASRIRSISGPREPACDAGYNRVSSYERSFSIVPLASRHCPRPSWTVSPSGKPG